MTKEIYDAKRVYAQRKMSENAQVNSLSIEQHDFLSSFAKFRHKYHMSMNNWFNTGVTHELRFCTDDFQVDFFNADFIYQLTQEIDRLGLPRFTANINILEIPDDSWVDIEMEEGGYDEDDDHYDEIRQDKYDKLYIQAHGMYARFHNKMESWLLIIDKEYGTKYCPTGLSRI